MSRVRWLFSLSCRGIYKGKSEVERMKERDSKRETVSFEEYQESKGSISGERKATSRKALDDARAWKIRKTCITKGVVLGLLSHVHGRGEHQGRQILAIAPSQPYQDGTVFYVKDIRAFCQVMMQAYTLLNTDAMKITEDAAEIDSFLEANLRHFANKGTLKGGVLPASKNMPWKALKNSLQEAGTGPLKLALKNRLEHGQGIEGGKDGGDNDTSGASKKRKRTREDWYCEVNVATMVHAHCFA
jgi:hypothetical protein